MNRSAHPAAGVYRPDIDGLRAVAVLAVLLFHCFPEVLSGGFVGVDVFFVISGYLIGKASFSELLAGRYSAWKYFGRRARRIFPALLVMLASVLAAGWWLLLPIEYELLGKHVAGAAVFISNWQFWREVGYFNTEATLKPLLHLWSLAVEEQFYLILPLLLLAGRRRPRRLPWLIGGLALISFVSVSWRLADHRAWAYFHLFSRCWELLLGVGLAYLQSGLRARPLPLDWPARWAPVASVLGLVLLLASAWGYSEQTPFPGPSALAPTLGAALLIAVGSTAPVNRALSWRPLVYVGLISYPLYLWHWPMLALLRLIDGGQIDVDSRLLVFALTFPLAALTYHLVEKPLRFSTFARRRAFPLLLWVLLLTLGAGGVAINKSGGWPERRSDWDTTLQPASAAQVAPPAGFASEKKAILLGDSHALMYADALHSHFFTHHRKEVIDSFRAGCKPFLDLDKHSPGHSPQECPQEVNPGIERAIGDPAIDTILVVASLASFTYMIHPQAAAAPSPDAAANYPIVGLAMDRTFARLAASGKKIIVFMTTPMLEFAPSTCQQRPFRWHSAARAECTISMAQYDELQHWSRERINRLAATYANVQVFDPARALCDEAQCAVRVDGRLIYGDKSHLNEMGAEIVARSFDF